jgi:hypothetical protein
MDAKPSLIYTLTALVAVSFFATLTRATTIDVIVTFDYPLRNTLATLPQKIEDQTDLVGTFIRGDGTEEGFIYKPLVPTFSPPIIPPFANGGPTQGRGINFRRHVVGEYLNQSDGTFHGYLMTHPKCTPTPTPTPSGMPGGSERVTESDSSFGNDPDARQPGCPLVFSAFDVVGASDTIPLGINNLGDIVGSAVFPDGTQPAFISVKRGVTTFAVPDATATFAYQINDSGQITGYYLDADGKSHGFMRDSAGALTFPIDVVGATDTFLLGNNASNWVVGKYTDALGVTHGLFYVTPDNILTYDYPGAINTSLTGINKNSLICGYYSDAAGISHGFVARVNVTASGKPNMNILHLPVKPLYTPPKVPGMSVPVF